MGKGRSGVEWEEVGWDFSIQAGPSFVVLPINGETGWDVMDSAG